MEGSVQITYDDPGNEDNVLSLSQENEGKPSGFCCSEVVLGGQNRFIAVCLHYFHDQ
jgi:hypothetical protein